MRVAEVQGMLGCAVVVRNSRGTSIRLALMNANAALTWIGGGGP